MTCKSTIYSGKRGPVHLKALPECEILPFKGVAAADNQIGDFKLTFPNRPRVPRQTSRDFRRRAAGAGSAAIGLRLVVAGLALSILNLLILMSQGDQVQTFLDFIQ